MLAGFWCLFGSGTPLQVPLGAEVQAEKLWTGRKVGIDLGTIFGAIQGPCGGLFHIFLK